MDDRSSSEPLNSRRVAVARYRMICLVIGHNFPEALCNRTNKAVATI